MPETISQAIADVRRNLDLGNLNENETRKFVVDRMLSALQWNLFSPSDMLPEYKVGPEKVDYALNPDTPGMAFLEIKKPGVILEGPPQQQLLKYCWDQNVQLGILTNGRLWWLFLPKYEGPPGGPGLRWTEKRFSQIDIKNGKPPELQKEFERFLSKEKVSSGEAVESAKTELTKIRDEVEAEKKIIETWNSIVATPSQHLTKLLIDSTFAQHGVKPKPPQVKEFFRQHRSRFKVSDSPPPSRGTNDRPGQRSEKPASFTFLDSTRPSRSWKQLLVDFCELVYLQHQDDFERIQHVRGRNKLHFSTDRVDLANYNPEPIGNSGIFAATAPMSSRDVKERCQMVLRQFGYREDDFKINLE